MEGSDNGYSTGFENRRPQGLESSNLSPSASLTQMQIEQKKQMKRKPALLIDIARSCHMC